MSAVVCGGAELYVTVSSMQAAGSKLPHLEITSDHLTITAACGASLILLENVLFLLEGDAQHDLHSQLVQLAAALSYILCST